MFSSALWTLSLRDALLSTKSLESKYLGYLGFGRTDSFYLLYGQVLTMTSLNCPAPILNGFLPRDHRQVEEGGGGQGP